MMLVRRLLLARVLVIAGFLAGWGSLGATVDHLGNEAFLLTSQAPVPTHVWHHMLRELGAQFGIMVAVLVLLFAGPGQRTRRAWWVMLVLLLGFYAPFWIGVPFNADYGAPSMAAELTHLAMAVPALSGLLLMRSVYRDAGQPAG